MTTVIQIPSSSSSRSIQSTYQYFSKKVDPIISPCVANFLSKQPMDIISALRKYFENIKTGMGIGFFDEINCYNPKINRKIYFTSNFGPVISKIIDLIAASQPADVVDFISIQLMRKNIASVFGGIIKSDGMNVVTVSTARNKLNRAINLANSIHNPTLETLQKPMILSPDKSLKSPSLSICPKGLAISLEGLAVATPIVVRNIQVTMLGLGGGGKTSIINALQGRFELKMKPSLGFKPTAMMLGQNINVKFYDLGGGPKIRSIWSEYYHDVHAVIYVFDASLIGDDLSESVALFESTMEHPSLSDKPLLVLANKQDKEGALSGLKLFELLTSKMKNIEKCSFAECSSFTSKSGSIKFPPPICNTNSPHSPRDMNTIPDDAIVDQRFELALELLLEKIQNNFETLDKRVCNDIEKRKNEEGMKRLERERKVLRNKIALAFKEQIEPSLLPENLPSANPEDTFTEIEGDEVLIMFIYFC